MKNYSEKYPKLHYFLGAYFHMEWDNVLDWQGHDRDFAEVVRFFKSHNTKCPEEIDIVKRELKEFLNLPLGESDLKTVSRSAGVYIAMADFGYTYRRWFEEILEVLEEPGNTTYLKWRG
jgi:hypothetical protein